MRPLGKPIQEFCPNGVKFAQLVDLGETYNGLSGKTKNDFGVGDSLYVPYMNVFSNLTVDFRQVEKVTLKPTEKQNHLQIGDVLITGSSEALAEVGMSSVVTQTPGTPMYLNSFCFGLRFSDSSLFAPDFLGHLFRSKSIRDQIVRSASGVTRYNISKNKFLKIRVPIPPIDVQTRIAQILNSFCELEAELEAELELRKTQLQHMRAQSLAEFFAGLDPVIRLGQVTDRISNVPWKDQPSLELEYVDLSSVSRKLSQITSTQRINKTSAPSRAQQRIKTGDVLLGSTRPLLRRLCTVPSYLDGQVCSTGFTVLRVNPTKLQSRFLFHVLSSDAFYDYVERNQEGASYPSISDSRVKDFTFTLPKLSDQARIASELDAVEALVNDVTSGIPSEIAARRKQYEYYRDQLLTFKEA